MRPPKPTNAELKLQQEKASERGRRLKRDHLEVLAALALVFFVTAIATKE